LFPARAPASQTPARSERIRLGVRQTPSVEFTRGRGPFDSLIIEGTLGELAKLPISTRIVRPSSVCPTTNGFACLKELCFRFIRAMRTVTKSFCRWPVPWIFRWCRWRTGNRVTEVRKPLVRLRLPAQPVDATPSSALIRQNLRGRTAYLAVLRQNPSRAAFRLV
jgi:hypothetical protein